MRKIVGAAFVSLDGVMQAPGGPSEDPTGGFPFGGWMFPLSDDEVGAAIGKLFAGDFDLLLGRRTYDIFSSYWPDAPDETKGIRDPFNRCTKYVVTRGAQALDWENSVRVGDLDALAQIKQEDGPDLVIQGSSTLYPQLLTAGLIDRLTLMTFPVLLGTGKRIFGEGTPPLTMKAVDHQTTQRGNLIVTYEPAGEVEAGSFGEPPENASEERRQEAMKAGAW
jgi:dihydrofolate reductase